MASAFVAGEGEVMDVAAAGCRWPSRITVRMVSRGPWLWPASDVHGLDPVASKARLPVRQLHDDTVAAAAVVSAAAASDKGGCTDAVLPALSPYPVSVTK